MRREVAGHMHKGREAIEKYTKLLDCPLLVLDSRVPESSWQRQLTSKLQHKLRIVLNKADLADPALTKKWRAFFEAENYPTFIVDAKSGKGMRELKAHLSSQVKGRSLRVAVLGMPNTGKSTILNRLIGRRTARVGNRPGITRGPQWVRVGKLEILDTPGILGLSHKKNPALAALGFFEADPENTAQWLLEWLSARDSKALSERYRLGPDVGLAQIAENLGFLQQGAKPDLNRAAVRVLADFQSGALGLWTLEEPQ